MTLWEQLFEEVTPDGTIVHQDAQSIILRTGITYPEANYISIEITDSGCVAQLRETIYPSGAILSKDITIDGHCIYEINENRYSDIKNEVLNLIGSLR